MAQGHGGESQAELMDGRWAAFTTDIAEPEFRYPTRHEQKSSRIGRETMVPTLSVNRLIGASLFKERCVRDSL